MKDYPTPETDSNCFSASTISVNMPPASARFCHAAFTKDLERRLAECREALERCEMWLSTYKDGRSMQLVCQQTLTNTAPNP
jgi:hypothetical protein